MPTTAITSFRLLVLIGFVVAMTPNLPMAARSMTPSSNKETPPRELMADFVANQGQWAGDIRFAARRGAFALALEPRAIHVSVDTPKTAALAFSFEGANPHVAVEGEGQRPTLYNFLNGRDTSAWRLRVPSYESVLYSGMYDGIDVRVRAQSAQFEYDLLITPRANVQQVVIRVDGAAPLAIGDDGALMIATDAGVMRQTPPVTFEILPDGTERPVVSAFQLLDEQRYSFVVPQRDESLPLVIDPGLVWSTLIGGTGPEQFAAIEAARDGSGDLFVTGSSYSTDFGSSPTPVHSGRYKAFVARLDVSGGHYDFVTVINGLQNQTYPGAMAADLTGGVTLVGTTVDLDFPVTPGAYQTTFQSATIGQAQGDAFVLRLNRDGSPVFGSYLGGSSNDGATAVAIDRSGSLIVLGTTRSPDFPTTSGAYDTTFNSAPAGDRTALSEDAFIARFSSDGSQLTYGTFFGGQTYEVPRDAVID